MKRNTLKGGGREKRANVLIQNKASILYLLKALYWLNIGVQIDSKIQRFEDKM